MDPTGAEHEWQRCMQLGYQVYSHLDVEALFPRHAATSPSDDHVGLFFQDKVSGLQQLALSLGILEE